MALSASPAPPLPLRLLLVDADDDAASILGLGIRKSSPATVVLHDREMPAAGRDYGGIDVALINHNLNDDSFSKCFQLKQRNPLLRTVVLSSPGESLRHFTRLQQDTGLIDDILEKPLHFHLLAQKLEIIAKLRNQRVSPAALTRLERHLPAGLSLDELEAAHNGDAIRTEKTILFADIRRSTELLRQHSLDEFFERLNRHFAMLGDIVERNRGEVIKYTGDGMLALFGGFARRYLGFRCAREILLEQQQYDPGFSIGLGLSDGLVMLGFIGTEQRLFYDVIGTNVNIAARFCADAGADELLMSQQVMQASGLSTQEFESRQLAVKGMVEPVSCYRYTLGTTPP